MAPHTSSATSEQIGALLDFLEMHTDLARGRLRSLEGKVQAKRLWDEISNTLNCMGGCTKTAQQWQKVWFDRKHLAKKAAAASRRSATGTGGGPSTAPQLSEWELKVLSIMGDGFGERQTGARVPAFPEISQQLQPSSYSEQVDNYVEPSHSDSPHIQHPDPATQPISPPATLTYRRCSQPTRHVRRQSASGSDIKSRLFRNDEQRLALEKTRNDELAGIRVALLELCGLLREHLNKK